jgi:predicted aldo/keto reductase-like oxidoreductase
MNRRHFIKASVLGSAVVSISPAVNCAQKQEPRTSEMPKRALGKTGISLSIVGFGGIIVMDEEQTVANNKVAQAYDFGINYYDVAPTYGNAQNQLGPALKPYRDKCFLACKTTQREKEGAEKELHESLTKLQTDHFDLYQLHALTTREDVEKAFAPNGAMEVFLKAREQGKVRLLGFSAHSEEAALLAMERFDFDTILFPINFVCWHQGRFAPRVIEKAQEKGMGILALKTLAYTVAKEGVEKPCKKCWYITNTHADMQDLAFRFTMSKGVTAAVSPGEFSYLHRMVEIAPHVEEFTEEQNTKLMEFSQGVEPIFKTV